MTIKILLIEDDLPLADLIITYLERHDMSVTHYESAELALSLKAKSNIELIICDIMLPGLDGFSVAPELSNQFECPLIFLTALDTHEDQIRGLEIGASDYVVKPVVPPLLLARIKANLRKNNHIDTPAQLNLSDLKLDQATQQVYLANTPLEFTTQEFQLLWIFAQQAGSIISREYLFEQLVKREYNGLDRAVDLKVCRLRKKLDDLSIPGLMIKTVHGKGYLFHYQPQTHSDKSL